MIWLVVLPFGAMQLMLICITRKSHRYSSMCRKCCRRKSILPSDVIHSYSGTSIEIMILMLKAVWSSLMVFYLIKKLQTRIYVDIATLTGSSVGTLGYECGALFTNNEALSKKTTKQEIQ
jgi:leucyl aminopeptidase